MSLLVQRVLLVFLILQEGTLEVIDIAACTRVHVEEAAHAGPVWSLALLPDKSGFVSGSADKTIKFWTWTVIQSANGSVGAAQPAKGSKQQQLGVNGEVDDQGGGRNLGIHHTRTLEMADDVLCVRVSADGRLLAAALLDATIKVYYVDR